jgi:hypothetical protein
MQNIMVYPASIACEIAPEYYSVDEPHLTKAFSNSTNTLLKEGIKSSFRAKIGYLFMKHIKSIRFRLSF